MELSKVLYGQSSYVTNVRVFSSGQLYEGALMMRAASAWTSGAPNDGSQYYFVVAALDTSSAARDTIGALQTSSLKAVDLKENLSAVGYDRYNIGADYFADALISVGGNYLPVEIAPDALYMAEYLQAADKASGANVISANISASTGTTVTITTLQDHLDGGFLFSTDLTSSVAYEPGQFRIITVSAGTGSCTIDSAMKVSTTTDFILGLPPMCSRVGLSDDGVGLCSLTDKTADDASEGLCQGLLIFENYISHQSSGGLVPVRYWEHRGMDGIDGLKAYAEVFLTDHILGRTVPA